MKAENKGFISDGILMPWLSHRFTVSIDGCTHLIMKQVIRSKINMVDRTVTLDIQQPATDMGLMREIDDICRSTFAAHNVNINSTNGHGGKILTRFIFNCAKPISHDCTFDYADTDIVMHTIVFKYESISTLNYPEIEQ